MRYKRSCNLGLSTRPCYNQQRYRSYRIVDFAVLADHKVKLKEKRKDKDLDLSKELNSRGTIVIGALGTVNKQLVQRLEDMEVRGRVETIQTTAF